MFITELWVKVSRSGLEQRFIFKSVFLLKLWSWMLVAPLCLARVESFPSMEKVIAREAVKQSCEI